MGRLILYLLAVLISYCLSDDWLLDQTKFKTTFSKISDHRWSLSNGIVERIFTVQPNFGTLDLYSHERQESLLRAFSPEAELVFYHQDDTEVPVTVGGFCANMTRGYLNRTGLELERLAGTVFVYHGHQLSNISSDIEWSAMRGAPASAVWPPPGLHLDVTMVVDTNDVIIAQLLANVEVHVHYHMYDGLPLIAKWITIACTHECPHLGVKIINVDQLAVNLEWSPQRLGGEDWLQVIVMLVTFVKGHLV